MSLTGWSAVYARKTLRALNKEKAKHVKEIRRWAGYGIEDPADYRLLNALNTEIKKLETDLGDRA